jgi:hypothetical protein
LSNCRDTLRTGRVRCRKKEKPSRTHTFILCPVKAHHPSPTSTPLRLPGQPYQVPSSPRHTIPCCYHHALLSSKKASFCKSPWMPARIISIPGLQQVHYISHRSYYGQHLNRHGNPIAQSLDTTKVLPPDFYLMP